VIFTPLKLIIFWYPSKHFLHDDGWLKENKCTSWRKRRSRKPQVSVSIAIINEVPAESSAASINNQQERSSSLLLYLQ
jgi:hypothetical protein